MTFTRHLLLLGALCLCAVAHADTDTPYTAIVTRNVFGLVPIPTNPPVDPTPATPPLKITPNGIMDIFGKLQALFKVAMPAKGGQPAHDESYVLGEGESQDDIEVIKIDKAAGVVTFNNHGVEQELPLVVGVASGGSAPAAAPGVPPSTGGPGGMLGGSRPGGGRFGRNPNLAQNMTADPGNPNPGGGPGSGGFGSGSGGGFGAAATGGNNNSELQTDISPEAQILLLEAQRMKAKAENDPVAPILPPLPPGMNKDLYGDENGPGALPAPPTP